MSDIRLPIFEESAGQLDLVLRRNARSFEQSLNFALALAFHPRFEITLDQCHP